MATQSSLKKCFIHYCRVSVSEGLNTKLCTSELMLGKYNKKVYQKCRYCHCVIEIKKAFTEDVNTCNKSVELSKSEDKIDPQIYIIWTERIKSLEFLQTFIVHL